MLWLRFSLMHLFAFMHYSYTRLRWQCKTRYLSHSFNGKLKHYYNLFIIRLSKISNSIRIYISTINSKRYTVDLCSVSHHFITTFLLWGNNITYYNWLLLQIFFVGRHHFRRKKRCLGIPIIDEFGFSSPFIAGPISYYTCVLPRIIYISTRSTHLIWNL